MKSQNTNEDNPITDDDADNAHFMRPPEHQPMQAWANTQYTQQNDEIMSASIPQQQLNRSSSQRDQIQKKPNQGPGKMTRPVTSKSHKQIEQ